MPRKKQLEYLLGLRPNIEEGVISTGFDICVIRSSQSTDRPQQVARATEWRIVRFCHCLTGSTIGDAVRQIRQWPVCLSRTPATPVNGILRLEMIRSHEELWNLRDVFCHYCRYTCLQFIYTPSSKILSRFLNHVLNAPVAETSCSHSDQYTRQIMRRNLVPVQKSKHHLVVS